MFFLENKEQQFDDRTYMPKFDLLIIYKGKAKNSYRIRKKFINEN